MNQATRRLSARLRNYMFYSLWLTGEVKASGWGMQVDRARLLAAIDVACGPPVTKGRRGSSTRPVTLTVCDRGMSVRSRAVACDVPGFGIWASPIVVEGARLRSLVAGMPGPEVRLEYLGGRLMVDWKAMKAREL